ncbi:tetratricopeptide repeat protein [Leptolyngbya sp. AN02str]|uniref:tetratricopeptide repeat protein n=1 Tax=Leptolyngbya sp. AN02str TaxID=3423363 RepID=UPI003D31612D
MTKAVIDWDSDLPPEPEEEYQALQRAIRRNQGFGLLFVQCSPSMGAHIIGRLREDVPQKRMATLEFTETILDGNLYREVKAFLAQQSAVDVLFIQGLEHSLYAYEDTKRHLGWTEKEVRSYSWKGVPPVMVNLNQQRENFRDSFQNTCFVFLIPPFAKNYLIHRAPDFFDWRSGIFELPVDKADLQIRSLSAYGNYDEYLKLTPAERVQKLAELRNLIDDPNQTIDRKAGLLFEQGNVFAANKDYEEAIAAYDQALTLQPGDHEALNNKGSALFNLGRYEEAIAAYDQALAIQPDDHDALYNKGIALSDLGRYEEAIAAYDHALAIQPDDHEALNNKGIALRNLGRYEEAIAAYDHALNIKPDKHEALINKGIALRNLGRYQEAIVAYDKALAINPAYGSPWYNKACCYGLQGKVEPAVEALSRAIELNSRYQEKAKTDSGFDAIRNDARFQALLIDSAQNSD